MKNFDRLKPSKNYLRPNIILLSVVGILALSFVLLSSELIENELSPFDDRILHYLQSFVSSDLTAEMIFVSNLGSVYTFLAILTIFVMASFYQENIRFHAIMLSINLIGSSGLNVLFKEIFHRARPSGIMFTQAAGYSFPSGHSMVSAAFYGYLIYLAIFLIKRPWKWIVSFFLMILIFLIGVSRIYLGVHYASDVVGGFLSGFAWLAFLLILVDRKFHHGSKAGEGKQKGRMLKVKR